MRLDLPHGVDYHDTKPKPSPDGLYYYRADNEKYLEATPAAFLIWATSMLSAAIRGIAEEAAATAATQTTKPRRGK